MSLGLAQPDKFSPPFHTSPHPHPKLPSSLFPAGRGFRGHWSYAQKILPQVERKRCRRDSTCADAPARACCVSFMIFNE